jgi:heterodisulfide reductase subunit C
VEPRVEENALPQHSAEAYPVESLAHTQLVNCYQCGKCTAGCPVSARMDLVPNQLIRLVQLGHTDTALRSQAIWECVSCQTCSTRCPKDVDCAGVLDALREISLAEGMVAPSQQTVVSFQKAFLDNIRRNGRLAELELIAQFKAAVFFRTGRPAFLFKDAGLAPELGKRKKLHFIPGKARDRKVVERIFAKCSKQADK